MDELALVSVLLAAVALISCLSVANKRTIRRLPRAAWLAVILLVPVLGATAWFLLGRPLSLRLTPPGPSWLPGRDRAPTTPAPDDDAEFLRTLDHSPEPAGEDEERGHRPDRAG